MTLLSRIKYHLFTPPHMKWYDRVKAEFDKINRVKVIRGTKFGDDK